jgi:hypothetical protein
VAGSNVAFDHQAHRSARLHRHLEALLRRLLSQQRRSAAIYDLYSATLHHRAF